MHRHPTPDSSLPDSADSSASRRPHATATDALQRSSKRPSLTLLAALLPLALAACATKTTPLASNADSKAAAQQSVQAVQAAASAVSPSTTTPKTLVASAMPVEKLDVLLEDNLNPGEKIDLDAPRSHVDLWARIRAGMAMPELDNDLVRKAEDWYSTRPDYVARMTGRGSLYLYHVVDEVEKRGMPLELALLPFIESAFRNDAQSSAKAVGMWQFMPATGRDFDLKQNLFRDDRRDVLASTKAALDYLQRLSKMFNGDWQLALAAYNWGPGNVSKAVARNQKAGLPIDYDSLRIPDETRYYLPKLQAVKNIVMRPEAYGLQLPPVANHPYFLSVNIDRDIDVARAAQLAELDEETFRQFNPSMNKPVILAASSGQILLPYDNASTFVANLEQYRGPLASWTAWVVPKTMKPGDAAKQVGMNETGLREINRIPARMLITKGSTLLVPRGVGRDQDVSEHLADNASIAFAPDVPPMRRVTLKANKGDTVASVARRYRLGTTQLAQWNKVSTKASFKPGQQVVAYVREGQTLAAVEPAVTTKGKNAGSSARGAKPAKTTRVASSATNKATKASSGKTRSAKVAARGGSESSGRTVATKTALR